MDIIATIGDERLYTFHSHTNYCDGHATVADMARAAVEAGFSHYGFSPHSPVPIESPCNMKAADVAAYLADVEFVRKRYADSGYRFYAGMEIDYLGPQWGPSSPYFATLGLDFSIGSVHFIPAPDGTLVDIDGRFENFKRKMAAHFDNDIEYVVRTFFRQSAQMIEAGGFDILGHFDKVAQNASYFSPGIEDSSIFRKEVSALIDLIIARKPIVELNTKSLVDHGRFFPSERYIPCLLDAGIKIIVNSDAHYPDKINASRSEAFLILDSAGVLTRYHG